MSLAVPTSFTWGWGLGPGECPRWDTYHIHTPGSTGLRSGGGEPLHTGHMWELEKNATEVREINSGTAWSRI